MTLAEFRRVYPTAAFTVSSGKLFTYRYYQNPQAKATLVLLTGGIGLSDLFYKHFATTPPRDCPTSQTFSFRWRSSSATASANSPLSPNWS